MPLYEWSSRRFADYGDGHIIVLAPTVAAARKKARAEYIRIYPRADASEIHAFMADMVSEPHVRDVIFITGSA